MLTAPSLGSALAVDNAFDFSFENIEGGQLALKDYSGKIVLVVNTATKCGNTHQLGTLQKAWTTYRDQGLVVTDVPSNDFGQERRKGKIIDCFGTVEDPMEAPLRTAQEAALRK